MSSGRTRDDSAPGSASETEENSGKPRSRAATVQDLNIATVTEASEPHSPAPESRPKLKEVRRGILSISEASVPLAQSSSIVAEGKVFAPQPGDRSHPVKQEADSEQGSIQEEDQPADNPGQTQETAQSTDTAQDDPPNRQADSSYDTAQYHPPERQAGSSDEEQPGQSKCKALEAALSPAHQKDPTDTGDLEQLSPVSTPSVPIIEIHRPSDAESTMSVFAAMTAIPPSTPASPKPSALGSTAPAAATGVNSTDAPPRSPPNSPAAPLNAVPAGLPVDGPDVTVPDVAMPGAGVPGVPQIEAPDLTVASKGKKRKRAVRKARKVILRKPVLVIILGREAAGTVHPLLSGANLAAAPVDVPVSIPGVPV